MFKLSMVPGYSIHYSGAENKDDLPPSQKQFWRWSQRFTDNPHLKQKTGVQDIELVQHIHQQYEPAGPNPDLVEDPVNILRDKAQGRMFPGTSWFDGKHLKCVCWINL